MGNEESRHTDQTHVYLSEEATEWERQRAERGLTGKPDALPWAPSRGAGEGVAAGDMVSPGPETVPHVAVSDGRDIVQLENLVEPEIGFTRRDKSAKMPRACDDGASYLIHTLETYTVQPGQLQYVDTGIELHLPDHVGMHMEIYPTPW